MIVTLMLFGAAYFALLAGMVSFTRGQARILRRQEERPSKWVYRAFRRGLQRDWKPPKAAGLTMVIRGEPPMLPETGAWVSQALPGESLKREEGPIAIAKASTSERTGVERDHMRRDDPIAGFILGIAIGMVSWRGLQQRLGEWQAGRR